MRFTDKLNEKAAEYKTKVDEKLKEYFDEGSEGVAEALIVGGGLLFTGSIAVSLFNKMIPSRSNVHIYIHIK